jgi:hypothetical protein
MRNDRPRTGPDLRADQQKAPVKMIGGETSDGQQKQRPLLRCEEET